MQTVLRPAARWAATWAATWVATASLLASGHAVGATCGPETTYSPLSDYSLTFRVCDNSFVGTVTARATGWVAVGFSRDQFMPGTDVFMAGVLPDGSPYGVDAFAFMRNPPTRDLSQDVSLQSPTELNGFTSYTFTRLLNTGDSRDFDLTDGQYYILGAFQSTSDSLTVRHSFSDASDLTYAFAPVPEPASVLMLLAGIGLLAGRLRRVL